MLGWLASLHENVGSGGVSLCWMDVRHLMRDVKENFPSWQIYSVVWGCYGFTQAFGPGLRRSQTSCVEVC